MEGLLAEKWRVAWLVALSCGLSRRDSAHARFDHFWDVAEAYAMRFSYPEIRQFPIVDPAVITGIGAEFAILDYLKHGEPRDGRSAYHNLMGKAL